LLARAAIGYRPDSQREPPGGAALHEHTDRERTAMNRRELVTGLARIALALPAATMLASCRENVGAGVDAAPAADALPPPGSCADFGAAGDISANHGHALVVTAADIAAGGDRDFDIQGTSSHPHTVRLSGAQLAMLAGNDPVTVTSSTDEGHSHLVMVVCASS
jgi:hypothetical protein